jgi:hypothetical protein
MNMLLTFIFSTLCCIPQPAFLSSHWRPATGAALFSRSGTPDAGNENRCTQKHALTSEAAEQKNNQGGPMTRTQATPNATELEIIKDGGPIAVDSAPHGADLETGGGNIHVKSAQGFVKASTGGGNITIDALAGGLQATTGAGEVRVTITGSSGTQMGDVTISSSRGDITVVVPEGFSMLIDFKLAFTNSQNQYRIVSDFPLEQRTTSDWSSAEGTPRKYIYASGTINGGNNRIRIQTVNGSIHLQKGR